MFSSMLSANREVANRVLRLLRNSFEVDKNIKYCQSSNIAG